MYVLVIVYGEVIVFMLVWRSFGVGEVVTRHAHTDMDVLKLLAVVALRLQLQHSFLSPIRLSIIHVRDFLGFSRYFRLYSWQIYFI